MKKFDFLTILFGVLLSIIALYLMLRPSTATSAPVSTISVVKIGNLAWDQTEMTIADVKMFAVATGFISQAEKNGGGLSYEAGFVKKPGWTWKTPYGVPAKDGEPAVHLNQSEAQSVCRFMARVCRPMLSGLAQHFWSKEKILRLDMPKDSVTLFLVVIIPPSLTA